jgi:hypothetical protein
MRYQIHIDGKPVSYLKRSCGEVVVWMVGDWFTKSSRRGAQTWRLETPATYPTLRAAKAWKTSLDRMARCGWKIEIVEVAQ